MSCPNAKSVNENNNNRRETKNHHRSHIQQIFNEFKIMLMSPFDCLYEERKKWLQRAHVQYRTVLVSPCGCWFGWNSTRTRERRVFTWQKYFLCYLDWVDNCHFTCINWLVWYCKIRHYFVMSARKTVGIHYPGRHRERIQKHLNDNSEPSMVQQEQRKNWMHVEICTSIRLYHLYCN